MSRDRAQWLEIAALVARKASVDFRLALEGLPRIAPQLRRQSGEASGQLRFHRFAEEVPGAAPFNAAEGEVSCMLALTCQRCLEPVEVAVIAHCLLAFVDDEEAAGAVPASHDPVFMTQGRVSLDELVEEELLLALPIAPLHEAGASCRPGEAQPDAEAGAEADTSKGAPTQRPFAGLRDLLKK